MRSIYLILGLALLTGWSGAARANLIVNGGFETGSLSPAWSVTGNGIAIDSAFPNSGSFDASFGAASTDPNPGVLSQTIATMPGQAYDLSFALLDESGVFLNTFTVTLGNFNTVITGDQSGGSYVTFDFSIPGSDITALSTDLQFLGLNDFAAWNLDDVSLDAVTAVPEPTAAIILGSGLLALLLLGGPTWRRVR